MTHKVNIPELGHPGSDRRTGALIILCLLVAILGAVAAAVHGLLRAPSTISASIFLGVSIAGISGAVILGIWWQRRFVTEKTRLEEAVNTRLQQLTEVNAALSEEIHQRKRYEDELYRRANYDSVTGLPNREAFFDRLRHAIAAAQRREGILAVLTCDLDQFKAVNDGFGHAIGDQLLIDAGHRLLDATRATDVVSRFGGDEFIVLAQRLRKPEDVYICADRILDRFAEPFDIEGSNVFVTTSVGIALYPNDGEDPETLLRNADSAMYEAKRAGRNTYRFFTSDIDARIQEKLQIENRLREALAKGEFHLVYQPIMDPARLCPVAAEALLRWDNPELGSVAPTRFIPLAEEIRVINPIGDWILKTAIREAAEWVRLGHHLKVSVNVSSVQLRAGDLSPKIAAILESEGLDPSLLQLEITESLLIDPDPLIEHDLCQLAEMGITLALDDFGTGYSALSYLRRLPIKTLKIDRSFTMEMDQSPANRRLVQAIAALCRSLDLEVVAEGVETVEQLDAIRQYGCHGAQGFLFAQPVNANMFRRLLKNPAWETPADAASA